MTNQFSADAQSLLDMVRLAARTADDKFGRETLILAVGDVLVVTDYFVITSGANRRQVKALADAVEEALSEAHGVKPLRVEGLDTLEWVLLDYGPFVVHVFDENTRAVYQLERLWGDRPRIGFLAS